MRAPLAGFRAQQPGATRNHAPGHGLLWFDPTRVKAEPSSRKATAYMTHAGQQGARRTGRMRQTTDRCGGRDVWDACPLPHLSAVASRQGIRTRQATELAAGLGCSLGWPVGSTDAGRLKGSRPSRKHDRPALRGPFRRPCHSPAGERPTPSAADPPPVVRAQEIAPHPPLDVCSR